MIDHRGVGPGITRPVGGHFVESDADLTLLRGCEGDGGREDNEGEGGDQPPSPR